MTTTLTTMPRSNEGKRNKKSKALNGLLSATALGLFLEGCKSSSSTETCTYNGQSVTCDEYDRLTSDTSSGGYYYSDGGTTISSGGSCTINGRPCADVLGSVVVGSALGRNGESVDNLLEGSSNIDTIDGGQGVDTISYANSDEGVEVDLSAGKGEKGDAEGDVLFNIENLVGSTQNDILKGNTQGNTIAGTSGDDVLQGGAGDDIYLFSEGDGKDTIVEVVEEGAVNTLMFKGDYEVSDFSFERSNEESKDLVITADTDGDGNTENEVTLENYFTSEKSTETAYSIVVQINDGEAFVPSLEG